jgi:UDP-N-acetyl-D-glucosamine/UDP-N-acetyl-D-galactosamine dehydrogenase
MSDRVISVIGLGYVGLPLAVAFGKRFPIIGFDINTKRLGELREGHDRTNEVSSDELKTTQIQFTDQLTDLRKANFHIVTVPTPVDNAKRPDLTAMLRASESVGKALKKGDLVVYESTVYPGVTEDECLPVLEKHSGLKGGRDFKVGYSPERINPGDKEHTFTKIRKVVAGQDAQALDEIAKVYESVVEAGVYRAQSIKVAEAAKVIENTQRDLNIALMNELSVIFGQMGIDTMAVLDAAATKWNFIRFTPGLVGGHCIGVDPYYLTHKAELLGYHPQVILAGRRINDGMGKHIAQSTIKEMIRSGSRLLKNSTVTVLGLTFKENCPDIRNTRVIDIVNELKDYGLEVQVCDPNADADEVRHEYGIDLMPLDQAKPAAAVIVAVAHKQFKELGSIQLRKLMNENPLLIDVKSLYPADQLRASGISVWRL